MRVISGTLKGQTVKQVPTKDTRPTSDKVKEAIFHVMGPYFYGGVALDLFAGSGSLGIEALSRGVDKAIFIDQSPLAIKTIKTNLKRLQIKERAEVYRNDAFRAIQILAKKKTVFDLILLDPPYELVDYTKLLSAISNAKLVSNDGYIYIEYSPQKSFTYNKAHFLPIFERKYSETIATMILQPK